MKRAFLIGGGVVGVLLIAVVAIAVYVLSSLDSLIQTAIETYGSQATKAEVTVSDVELDLTSGKGAIRGLQIGNPAGYNTPTALMLGAIAVQVDTSTVTSDPVVISSITIDSPDVTYELGKKESNIDALQRNVESFASAQGGGTSGGGSAEKPAAGGSKSEKTGPKFIIDDLYVKNGKVNVSATLLEGKTLSAPLPDIHLTGIGRDSGGADAEQIATQVLGAIMAEAKQAAGGIGIGNTLDSLQKNLSGASGDPKKALEGAGEGLKNLLK
jgi:hypothetical protein